MNYNTVLELRNQGVTSITVTPEVGEELLASVQHLLNDPKDVEACTLPRGPGIEVCVAE